METDARRSIEKLSSTEVEYRNNRALADYYSSSDGIPPFLGLLCTIPLPL